MIIEIVAGIAAGYQLFAMVACLGFRKAQGVSRQRPSAGGGFGVSILKPIRGLDAGIVAAIESHSKLHGEYELLCGVRSLDDPAVDVLCRFPQVRVVECRTQTPNGKVGVLIDLLREAGNPIVVVNDADIRVDPDYLERVTAPLADPRNGLVTCLYRAEASSFAGRFEGLGVATDFAPSTLVARMVGVDEFALGSTLAFRRSDLERIGGFEAIAGYLADDYQLGHRLHALKLRCVLSDVIVTTQLGGSWGEMWSHQVRWTRTIRVSKFSGYLGLPVTFATLWAAVAAGMGAWNLAAGLMAVRILMAIGAGWGIMRSRDVLRLWFLIPVRDLFGVAVWITALFGNSVIWRGERLRLDRAGRIR